MSTKEERMALAKVLKEERGYPNEEIAKAMGISKSEVRELLGIINWGYNCLTVGVHHGRPEAIWNLPLGYAKLIYGQDVLKDLVVSRIYNDAMQMVEHGDGPRMSKTWADQTKEYAENWFSRTLRQKLVELDQYYTSSGWEKDIQGIVERVKMNKLNPFYQPLHGHDSINMLCRILGSQASLEARKDVT